MYYVTKDLLKQLPEESRMLIESEGLTSEEIDQMPDDEKAKLMTDNASVIQAPDTEGSLEEAMAGDAKDKTDDSMKLPKAMKYGDESEYESPLTEDGELAELPESKKNEIDSFEEANKRGNALIEEMSKPKPKPGFKKKKDVPEVSQDELDQ